MKLISHVQPVIYRSSDHDITWKIRVLRNTSFNLVNASLALGVRKSENPIVFFDLDKSLDLDVF